MDCQDSQDSFLYYSIFTLDDAPVCVLGKFSHSMSQASLAKRLYTTHLGWSDFISGELHIASNFGSGRSYGQPFFVTDPALTTDKQVKSIVFFGFEQTIHGYSNLDTFLE